MVLQTSKDLLWTHFLPTLMIWCLSASRRPTSATSSDAGRSNMIDFSANLTSQGWSLECFLGRLFCTSKRGVLASWLGIARKPLGKSRGQRHGPKRDMRMIGSIRREQHRSRVTLLRCGRELSCPVMKGTSCQLMKEALWCDTT